MLYCSNCSRILRPYDIWFLYEKDGFYQRKLYIGKCPQCKKDVVALVEMRKTDGKIFIDRRENDKAAALIDKCITQLWYRHQDTIFKKGRPFGFIYGENRENKKGRLTFACDFFGNKELISL